SPACVDNLSPRRYRIDDRLCRVRYCCIGLFRRGPVAFEETHRQYLRLANTRYSNAVVDSRGDDPRHLSPVPDDIAGVAILVRDIEPVYVVDISVVVVI